LVFGRVSTAILLLSPQKQIVGIIVELKKRNLFLRGKTPSITFFDLFHRQLGQADQIVFFPST